MKRLKTMACTLGVVLAAAQAAAQELDLADLQPGEGFEIETADLESDFARSVAGAGDFNGDGFGDLIIGEPGADVCLGEPLCVAKESAGKAYIVFGGSTVSSDDVNKPETGGIVIYGANAGDFAGLDVAAAGDFNGDRYSDVVLRTQRDNGAVRAYVLFGSRRPSSINLADFDTANFPPDLGFYLDGISASDDFNADIAGVGDIDADGLDDLLVGAAFASPNGRTNAGVAFLVFGKTNPVSGDINSLGSSASEFEGPNASDLVGAAVSGAGDFNGDGYADVALVSRDAPNEGAVVYIIFGTPLIGDTDLANLGSFGLRIVLVGSEVGEDVTVASLGDTNGDGYGDILIGDRDYKAKSANDGAAFVVFGRAESDDITISDASADPGWYSITGIGDVVNVGWSVAGLGDFTGDGNADIPLSAPVTSSLTRSRNGETFVIRGSNSEADLELVDLAAFPRVAASISGGQNLGESGKSISGLGDFNGDGVADLVVNSGSAFSASGFAYPILSQSVPQTPRTFQGFSPGGDAQPIAVGSLGGMNDHGTHDSRVWLDFADGGSFVNGNRVAVELSANLVEPPIRGAVRAMWHVTTERTPWTSAEISLRYLNAELPLIFEGDLEILRASSRDGPFHRVPTLVSPESNRVTATTDELGYFIIAPTKADNIFADGFDLPAK